MIRYQDLKLGDYVVASNDGDAKRGEITDLNGDEKQVCVKTGEQEFWYETEQILPIPITDDELKNLKFHRETNEDGTIKYMKGAFRMLVPKEGDFSRLELWYRDEERHITEPIYLNQLQNHFHDMTKVLLDDTSFD